MYKQILTTASGSDFAEHNPGIAAPTYLISGSFSHHVREAWSLHAIQKITRENLKILPRISKNAACDAGIIQRDKAATTTADGALLHRSTVSKIGSFA